jgi:class 3 adenylate cyclase
MEPRIQYAQTADEVSIAFATLGEGPLLVLPALPGVSEIQPASEFPALQGWLERMAQGRRVVWYDCRGTGLSQREVADYSLDAMVMDLDTVANRLEVERFVLLGRYFAATVAISYAAHHRDRVSHLVLWSPYVQASDFTQWPQAQALLKVLDTDWELFTETLAHSAMHWSGGEAAHRAAALIREGVTHAGYKAWIDALPTFDVSDVLSQITAPTLVLQPRASVIPRMNVAMNLASRIPNARLAVLEGTSALRTWATRTVAAAIDEFLSEGVEPAVAVPPEAGAFRTILFTDVEGSTALTQRLGDTKAREVLRGHERIVREALKAHGGSEVKTMGDGFMASFGSATRALECAIAMQRAFAEWNAAAVARPSTGSGRAEEAGPGRAEVIRVRIGLNAGEPIAEEGDLFGTAVILASRIGAKAAGGEILASDVVRQLVAGKGFLFSDRGETALRGFEDPVRLFEVRWRKEA